MSEWISVKDRLPDGSEGDWVLGVVNGDSGNMKMENFITLVCFDPSCGWYLEEMPEADIAVSHWMPLPELPEEVKMNE